MLKEKSFTIIELVVVVAIIAVLAVIVGVNVVGYIQKAKDAATLGQLKQIQTFATDYYNNYGSYSNLCNTDKMKLIATNIKKWDPTYSFSCYDNAGHYFVYGRSLIPYAYADTLGSCLVSQYIAFIDKHNNHYSCVSYKNSKIDFTGSDDMWNSANGCSCF